MEGNRFTGLRDYKEEIFGESLPVAISKLINKYSGILVTLLTYCLKYSSLGLPWQPSG